VGEPAGPRNRSRQEINERVPFASTAPAGESSRTHLCPKLEESQQTAE